MTKVDVNKGNGQTELAQDPRGKRFTGEQRQRALTLIVSGMEREQVARTIGATTQSLRRWEEAARASGKMPVVSAAPVTGSGLAQRKASSGEVKPVTEPKAKSPYAPADPAHGLADYEIAAILETKRLHPSMGPAQLRAQLKRFKGWRLSIKAIARVLRGHGYELVHRGSRPKGPEPVRFEAPRRNALWQLDFAEVRVEGDKLHVLIILDDFSRYVVGHAVCDSPTSNVATQTLQRAIARHGKPEAVRTDRGGAFVAFGKETDFGRFLEAELIDHIVGRSYSPKGGGKVESAVGTLRRELWEVEHFGSRLEAEQRLRQFFQDYNEKRAHMGIDGLTPADRFMGRADRVLEAVQAISRRRQGAEALLSPLGQCTEELSSERHGAPLEVLRLVLVEGVMELRFCGARVRLGPIAT